MSITAAQPKRQTKGERTKERIRQGVRNLLATRDFAEIAIEDVVEETGLPVGSIYFHFKNKDGLMTALAEEGINDFFNYFANIDQEDLFGAAFLYCWRSVQQYVDRRGHTQLTLWYLNQSLDNMHVSWLPRRQRLIDRLAAVMVKELGRRTTTDNDLLLTEMLFTGAESLLVTQSKLSRQKGKIRGEAPRDLAMRLAENWYRAVFGPDCALPRNRKKTVDRIVASTKLLKRPIALPPV